MPSLDVRSQRIRDSLSNVQSHVKEIVIGQDDVIDGMLIGLISSGHVLIEGFPGLAKTLLVKTVARAFDCKFSRI